MRVNDELKRTHQVQKCKTLEELATLIEEFSESGFIQGTSRKFDAKKMANKCRDFNPWNMNGLTRRYGIRGQASMIWAHSKRFYESDVIDVIKAFVPETFHENIIKAVKEL